MPTQCEIQTCINNLTCSSDLTEMVVLAAETNDVTTDRSIPVANVNSLPDLALGTISVGTIFFIQSLNIPVVAGVGSWMTLDNRVVRQDVYENTIWMWGGNFSGGQLGDNSTVNKSSPVSIVGGFCDWSQVSAGRRSTAAVRTNGTAWAWGLNNQGGLGDNTTTNRSSPVSVIGGYTDWCQVSSGNYFTLGLRTNSTLWAWGNNQNGQLGDNTDVSRSSPVSVVGGFTDWCQVAAPVGGTQAVSAVRTNGTLWSWGYNTHGQLGDNTTVAKSSPVSVVGGFTDWCRVSRGYHTIALRQNGTIWAWGYNNKGQLGDNTTVNKSSPVSVIGGFTDWCQLSAGSKHSLGVRTNGTAWAWGYNNNGQLGDNTTTNTSSPVSVIGGFTDWCQVSGAYQASFGLRTNGTAWAWGRNTYGTLGDNTVSGKSSPVSIAGGFTDWICLSYPQSGSFTSGAIRST